MEKFNLDYVPYSNTVWYPSHKPVTYERERERELRIDKGRERFEHAGVILTYTRHKQEAYSNHQM